MTRLSVTIDGRVHIVELDPRQRAELAVTVDGRGHRVVPQDGGSIAWMLVDDRPFEVVVDPELRWLRARSGLHQLEVRDLAAGVPRPASGDGRVLAPIPGLVAKVLVTPGDAVEAGEPLLILEAMKMENPIAAPIAGVVARVDVAAGQRVALNEPLAELRRS